MSEPVPPGDDLPARLRRALTAALHARDMTAAAALRSALGAIGNAEAVPVPPAARGTDPAARGTDPAARGTDPAAASAGRAAASTRAVRRGSPHVAGTVAGPGAAEAERRCLSPAQVAAIVAAEIDERREAAAQYERAGHADRAARLAAEAQALAAAAGGGQPSSRSSSATARPSSSRPPAE
jgi:uncharacterized protein